MTKRLILIILTASCLTLNAADKYSHWSIMVNGGFNMLITERMGDWYEYKMMGRNFKNRSDNYVDNFAPAGLFQADYMITPQFGVRMQYLYASINKKAIYLGDYVDVANNIYFSDKDGQSHQATVQFEINMLNLFYRCRKNKQWGWYLGAGVGALLYKIPTFTDYKAAVCIPLNTSIEYSPIPSLSIVFHAEYDWYGDDELNGWDPDDQLNDMGLYCGLGLRYNIAATNNKRHVRVTDMCAFEPLRVSKAADPNKTAFKDEKKESEQEDINELQDKVDELEKRNRELSDKIELMNREIMERLDKYMTETKTPTMTMTMTETKTMTPTMTMTETKTETETPTPTMTKAEIKQQQIYTEAMMSNGTEANEIFFDLESSRVKSKYEIKIAAVAKRMLANKKLKLDIFAYMKKSELTKSNVKLATQRLESIYYILINRYQIDPNRVRYDIQDLAEDDGDTEANTRCDMVYR